MRNLEQSGSNRLARRTRRAVRQRIVAAGAARAAERALSREVKALRRELAELQQQHAELRDSEESYRALFDLAPVGTAVTTYSGKVIAFNRKLRELAGLGRGSAQGMSAAEFYVNPADRRRFLRELRRKGRLERQTFEVKRRDGSRLDVQLRAEQLSLGGRRVLVTSAEDVTVQKQTEHRLAGVAELLKLFATKESLREFLTAAVGLVLEWCGCHCAGIRLLEADGRMPFVVQRGFAHRFLARERSLCLGENGCACGRVLSGNLLPSDGRLSSPMGSVFCNDTLGSAPQLALSSHLCTMAACQEEGYSSLAHAPIRYRGEMVGSIHLADRAPGRFPAATVQFIESVAPLIGEAIHRFKVEESLQSSEARFRSLFERHNAVMLLIDPLTGEIVDANPAAAAFYNRDKESLCRMRFGQLNALAPEIVAGHLKRAAREKRNFFELPHRLADGAIRTVEVHTSTMELGRRQLLFSIVHDITRRKVLEKQVLEISEQERRRVGRDLHDSLGGKLTGIALMSKALAQKLAAKGAADAALAEEVVQRVNESILQTRSIARGLSPVDLQGAGLASVLAEFAAETEKHSGVFCRFVAAPGVRVKDAVVASHLFRIAQEAVNNALRHASATRLTITLKATDGKLELDIADDGRGLPRELPPHRGLGLSSMKYRADLIGAELRIKPIKPHGTRIHCSINVGKTQAA